MEFLIAIAKGLLSAAAGSIFKSVFSCNEQGLSSVILAQIQNLIAIEAVSNDVIVIQGALDGVINQMSIDFVTKQQSGASPGTLLAYLQGIETTLDDNVMGPLQSLTGSPNDAKGNLQQSLLVYLLGGGSQFAVLQEMAKNDTSVTNPVDSQYAQDISAYATKYAGYAQSLLTALYNSRINSITFPTADAGESADATAGAAAGAAQFYPTGTRTVETSIYDGWLNEAECVYSSACGLWTPIQDSAAWAETMACAPGYISSVKTQFNAAWAGATQTISAWNQLISAPMGTASSSSGE